MNQVLKIGCGVFLGLGAIGIIVMLFFGYIFGSVAVDMAEAETERTTAVSQLEFSELAANKDGDDFIVSGKITNNSSMVFSYISFEIELLDKDESVIGSRIENLSGLDTSQVYIFKKTIYEDDLHSFRIRDITGR